MKNSSNYSSLIIGFCLSCFLLQKTMIFQGVSFVFSLLVLTSLVTCLIYFRTSSISKKVIIFVGLLTSALLIHILWCVSIGNVDSIFLTVKVIIFTLLISISVSISDPEKTYNYLLKVFIIFSIISSVYGFILLLFGTPTYINGQRVLNFLGLYQYADGVFPFYRLSGLFDNANSAGIIALFGIVSIDCYKGNDSKKATLLILINFIFILLTGSRTALILTLIYFIIVNINLLLSLKFFLKTLLFLIPVIIFSIYLIGQEIDLLKYVENRIDDGLSSRDIAWRYLQDWIVDYPLGIGLGHADFILLNEIKLGFGSHSGHLALLAEVGILLYAFIIFLLGFTLYDNYKAIKRKKVEVPFLIIVPLLMFIQQFIERGVFQITYHHFLLITLLLLPITRSKRNEYSSNNVPQYK